MYNTDYKKLLIKAMNRIPEYYYSAKQKNENEPSLYERRFTMVLFAEFYKENYENAKNEGIYIDTEMRKRLDYPGNINNSKFTKTCNRLKSNNNGYNDFYPDLFFHKAQDNNSPDYQMLIVEIKTKKNLEFKKFAWDLMKCNMYVDQFNYQSCCFIIINTPIDIIEKHIKTYIKKDDYCSESNKDKIYFIIKPTFTDNIKELRFSNFFNSLQD